MYPNPSVVQSFRARDDWQKAVSSFLEGKEAVSQAPLWKKKLSWWRTTGKGAMEEEEGEKAQERMMARVVLPEEVAPELFEGR